MKKTNKHIMNRVEKVLETLGSDVGTPFTIPAAPDSSKKIEIKQVVVYNPQISKLHEAMDQAGFPSQTQKDYELLMENLCYYVQHISNDAIQNKDINLDSFHKACALIHALHHNGITLTNEKTNTTNKTMESRLSGVVKELSESTTKHAANSTDRRRTLFVRSSLIALLQMPENTGYLYEYKRDGFSAVNRVNSTVVKGTLSVMILMSLPALAVGGLISTAVLALPLIPAILLPASILIVPTLIALLVNIVRAWVSIPSEWDKNRNYDKSTKDLITSLNDIYQKGYESSRKLDLSVSAASTERRADKYISLKRQKNTLEANNQYFQLWKMKDTLEESKMNPVMDNPKHNYSPFKTFS